MLDKDGVSSGRGCGGCMVILLGHFIMPSSPSSMLKRIRLFLLPSAGGIPVIVSPLPLTLFYLSAVSLQLLLPHKHFPYQCHGPASEYGVHTQLFSLSLLSLLSSFELCLQTRQQPYSIDVGSICCAVKSSIKV